MPQKVLIRKDGLFQQYTPKDTSTTAVSGDLVALNANAKVDPSLLANGVLTGGTVNQVLAKTDSVNYNVKWLTLGTAAFQATSAFATAAQGTLATNAIPSSQKGAANGVATLGADSKIPNAQLPPLAITSTFVVASEAAMLALDAQEGDVAVRTDLGKTFIHTNSYLGTMADWQEMLTPTAPVQSVNGQLGAVVLTAADVGAQPANANLNNATSAGAAILSAATAEAQRAALGVDASADVVHKSGAETVAGVKTFLAKSSFSSGLAVDATQTIDFGTAGATISGTAFGSVLIGAGNASGATIAFRPRGYGSSTNQVSIDYNGAMSWAGDDSAKASSRASLQAVGLIGDETVAGVKTFSARPSFSIGAAVPASQQIRWTDGTTDYGSITASATGLATIAGNLNAGAGGVVIRPVGINSSTGQFTINPDGSTTWGGNAASKTASRASLGAIADTDLYGLTGWNGTGNNTQLVDANDITLPTRVYRTLSTSLNIPVGPGTDGVLTVMRGTNDQIAQTWMSVRDLANARTPTFYTRGYYGTSQGWSPWYRHMAGENNLAELSNTFTARDNLLRVASTTSGSSGSENYWAKICDVTYASSATNYLQLVLLQDFYGTSAKSAALLNICLRFQSATNASGVIDIMARGTSAGVTTNYKITSEPLPNGATGAVYSIWVKKSAAFDRPYFSELSRTVSSANATTLTWYNNATWQSTEPVGSLVNIGVTSFNALDNEVVHLAGTETITGTKTFSQNVTMNLGAAVGNDQTITMGSGGAAIRGAATGALVLGASGTGGIRLRPAGHSDLSGQFGIDPDGSVLFGGDSTVKAKSRSSLGAVGLVGDETVAGIKTFSNGIVVANGQNATFGTGAGIYGNTNGSLIMGTSTNAGSVLYLRPSGYTSGTNEIQITTDGSMNLTGGGITTAGQIMLAGGSTGAAKVVRIGSSRTADGPSYLDLVGESGRSDYNTRFYRNSGVNGDTNINHRGTGSIIFNGENGGATLFRVAGVQKVSITDTETVFTGTTRMSGVNVLQFGTGTLLAGIRGDATGNILIGAEETGGSGQIYLRPGGVGTSANQTTINKSGAFSFGGDDAAKLATRRSLQLPITISATAPTSPSAGDIWMDIS